MKLNQPGYIVLGVLAFGLTQLAVSVTAWLGFRIPPPGEALLYVRRRIVA